MPGGCVNRFRPKTPSREVGPIQVKFNEFELIFAPEAGPAAGALKQGNMRSWHKRFGVIAGFVILLLLLGLSTTVLRYQLALQVGHQAWFSHSKRVVQALRDTESLLIDAETAQRGYLYTGRVEYLAPYHFATAEIETRLHDLTVAVGDNPQEQGHVGELRALTRQKLDEIGQTIALVQNGDPAGAKTMVMSGIGFSIMEKIRSQVGRMEQGESTLSEQRRADYQRSIRLTIACIYIASLIAALGLVLLAVFVLREMEKRERDAGILRQREEWFRVTLSSIGDGVIVTDDRGRVSFLNPVAERLTGVGRSEAAGRSVSEIFPIFNETTNAPEESPVDRILLRGGGGGFSQHSVLRQRNGQLLPIEETAAAIQDDSGKPLGVVLVFHDASRERNFQNVLRRTEKLAAAARLAATVSHEINNPLEAVGNLIFLARRNPALPEGVKEHLLLAEQELARVSHITRQTLGFYRESTLPTSVDIAAIVESTLKLYSNKLQHKQIKMRLALDACPPLLALGGEIQQLVSNIIANAIDALPLDGTLRIRSSVTRLAQENAIALVVEDDGPGISPENLERIFEPFFTTKQDIGTGLGLWVCKEIATRHGGSVQVRSKHENGTTGAVFTIQLPYRETKPVGELKDLPS
jgi:PAS domain S-box-containing protein